MNIVILTHSFYPAIGGIEIISEIFADEFQNKGNRVKVITWTTYQDQEPFDYKVIRKPGISQLLKTLLWADCVVEHNPCLQLSWPLLFIRKKHVIILQTWFYDLKKKASFKSYLKKLWLKQAEQVCAVSESIQDGIYPNAVVIHNPYKSELFYDKHLERHRDFVFLGRLVSDKGADLAVELISRLNNAGASKQNYSLTIIGTGEDKERIERLIVKYHLEDSVHLVGAKRGAEIVDLLNDHRFLLAPSRWKEPFGIIALEGMACGCIPIVSDDCGLEDAIGNAGIAFKRNDLEDLVYKTKVLLDDVELQNKLKSQMPAHLKAHTASAISSQYLELIAQL
ncbi:glycosyltransferase family 4 protein [Leeuwenhoekiella nanhaiensis]|uniref:Glycosyl transferase family 1 domain-containing protein n=1 Tax=Leeuwenhoekiella nanhaiensis TaxID=1655491 RepID=A0A2G1VNE1_9FLAO|nr:glycosyltransferase family 4 protein [Leeuwenhoekiella nanhaiensis]PHQ28281.1 hypothetical protein CJ305_15710 [Leeuwenhoekiella nanhaiensis]